MNKAKQHCQGFMLPIIVVLMLSSILVWTQLQRPPTDQQSLLLEKQADLIYFWQQAALNYIAETGQQPFSFAYLLNTYDLSLSVANDELRTSSSILFMGNYTLLFEFPETNQLDAQLAMLAPYATRKYNKLVIENLHVDQWDFSKTLQPRFYSRQAKTFFTEVDMTGNQILNAQRVVAEVLNGDLQLDLVKSQATQLQSLFARTVESDQALLGDFNLVVKLNELAAFNRALKACLSAAGICRN
ncbi:hypothetical protein [Pseudidiomarina salilacus]|uniref:hypothetical protein n=1 Tax=Pseudidiomarina salilacus TaxID=3384452 RepID=UPI0039853275